MSNIASTLLAKQTETPKAGPKGPRQQAFDTATMDQFNNAAAIMQNAAGQGMQLNPMLYQMLGLQPTYADTSQDVSAANEEFSAAQQQLNEAQKTFDQLKGIPQKKRSKAQRQQFRQLKKNMGQMQQTVKDAQSRFTQAQAMPQTITGFQPMDPNQIDPRSFLSGQNPLNQLTAGITGRAQDYLKGGDVDPTMVDRYNKAEQKLRAQLTERYGPDFENTSVGQMALQNFQGQRDRDFATWNEAQTEKYNQMAMQNTGNLQTLQAGLMGLLQSPSQTQMATGGALEQGAAQRLAQSAQNLQERAARTGLAINAQSYSPAQAIGAGLGSPVMQGLMNRGINYLTGANAATPASVAVPTYGAVAGADAAGAALSPLLASATAPAVAGAGTVLAPAAEAAWSMFV